MQLSLSSQAIDPTFELKWGKINITSKANNVQQCCSVPIVQNTRRPFSKQEKHLGLHAEITGSEISKHLLDRSLPSAAIRSIDSL